MRKILVLLLSLVLLFTAVPSAFAHQVDTHSIKQSVRFTDEDVKSLEKYVFVNEEGYFELDINQATRDRVHEDLIKGQNHHFDLLNELISQGKLVASSDLSIKSNIKDHLDLAPLNSKSSCGGVTEPVVYHWWGYSRLLNSCDANGLAADLAAAASVSAGVAVVAGIFGGVLAAPPGIAAAYWGLVSARIYANNSHNTGIYFGMTWVYAFNIDPQ